MKFIKKMAALFFATVLCLSMALPAFAGEWVFDGPESWKWWYKEDNGNRVTNGWKQIDGEWYHFKDNGYIDTGWINLPIAFSDGEGELAWENSIPQWYYLDASGKLLKNQNYIGGYTDDTGLLHDDMFLEGMYYRGDTNLEKVPAPPVEGAKFKNPLYDYGYAVDGQVVKGWEYASPDYKTEFFNALSHAIGPEQTDFSYRIPQGASYTDKAFLESTMLDWFLKEAGAWSYSDDGTGLIHVHWVN